MAATRGRPFEAGNTFGKGRPKGSKNKIRAAIEEILKQHGEAVMRKCILQAMQGDKNALRLCLERLLPARRDGFVSLPALRIRTSEDVAESGDKILRAVSQGRITPADGEILSEILERRRRVIETTELLARIEKLEAGVAHSKR